MPGTRPPTGAPPATDGDAGPRRLRCRGEDLLLTSGHPLIGTVGLLLKLAIS